MSSEQEESTDHPDEPILNSNANVDQSLKEKGNGPREHAKPRRRRRGKKRKQKKESAATCEAENPEECELHAESEHGDSDNWGSDDNSSSNYYDALTDVMIRPVNVPKAPLNSTQFIMDDHDDCRFYMSFETPNPYGDADSHLDRLSGDIIEPIGEDAAYIDIDYQYESPQDFDNSAYYDKEFELSYKNNRFEELMRQSRSDLIKKLQALELRLKELSDDLVKENPSPVLEKLQAELLELQEKNSYLKQCNTKLTAVLLQSETECSGTVTCHTLVGVSVSHDEHESEDSEREIRERCNEVVMSESANEICDKSSEVEMADSEVDGDQRIDHDEKSFKLTGHDSVQKDTERQNYCSEETEQSRNRQEEHRLIAFNVTGNDKLSSKSETEECSSNYQTIINSEDRKRKRITPCVMHCQPNSRVSDDLRTLNIISSELFHNANQTKCSSSVPLEGSMSPSETSVN